MKPSVIQRLRLYGAKKMPAVLSADILTIGMTSTDSLSPPAGNDCLQVSSVFAQNQTQNTSCGNVTIQQQF